MAETLAIILVVSFFLIIPLMIISQWYIFKKARMPGWYCLIPVYGEYKFFELAFLDTTPFWVMFISAIVSNLLGYAWSGFTVIGGIILLIFEILLGVRLSQRFGHGGGFAVGLILLPVIFYPILAFGSSRYMDFPGSSYAQQQTNATGNDPALAFGGAAGAGAFGNAFAPGGEIGFTGEKTAPVAHEMARRKTWLAMIICAGIAFVLDIILNGSYLGYTISNLFSRYFLRRFINAIYLFEVVILALCFTMERLKKHTASIVLAAAMALYGLIYSLVNEVFGYSNAGIVFLNYIGLPLAILAYVILSANNVRLGRFICFAVIALIELYICVRRLTSMFGYPPVSALEIFSCIDSFAWYATYILGAFCLPQGD